jgi:GINS complex subunit 3
LGYLEGTPGADIKEGTKTELPFWIAEFLALAAISETSDVGFVNLLQPDALHKKVINAIKTSPVSLDLHSISPHFYALVEKWAMLYEDNELSEVAQEMLKERADEINNYAQNLRGTHQESGFLYSMDEFEKTLYKTAHESYKQIKKWMHNENK